jgi:hypothetical protein
MRYSVSEDTVRRWKKRDNFEDRSHRAHRLQTTLTPAQEIVVVELRRMLLLPLDDLLAIAREFLNPDVSRSGISRCLRRYDVGNTSCATLLSTISSFLNPRSAVAPLFRPRKPGTNQTQSCSSKKPGSHPGCDNYVIEASISLDG